MKETKPRLNLTLDEETARKVEVLKKDHYINISAFIRKSIEELYERLEK
jgi:hypothetical protein